MKTFSFKFKNSEVGNSDAPLEHDLDAILGTTITEVKSMNVVKLDDVYSMMTVTATVSGGDDS